MGIVFQLSSITNEIRLLFTTNFVHKMDFSVLSALLAGVVFIVVLPKLVKSKMFMCIIPQ